jgi:putative phosphoesterase
MLTPDYKKRYCTQNFAVYSERMIIGIMSDTHDRLATVAQAFDILSSHHISFLIHCGDWTKPETMKYIAQAAAAHHVPFAGVLGNRDDKSLLQKVITTASDILQLPPDFELLSLTLDGVNVLVYHGHHKPTLARLTQQTNYDVLFTGHTHKPLIQKIDNRLIINPGSTAFSIPRRKEPRSVAVYDTSLHAAKLIFFEAGPH